MDYQTDIAGYPAALQAHDAKVSALQNDLDKARANLAKYMYEDCVDGNFDPGTQRKLEGDMKEAKHVLDFEIEFGRPKQPIIVEDSFDVFERDLRAVLEAEAFRVDDMVTTERSSGNTRFCCRKLVDNVNESEFCTHRFYLRSGSNPNRAVKLKDSAMAIQANVDREKLQRRETDGSGTIIVPAEVVEVVEPSNQTCAAPFQDRPAGTVSVFGRSGSTNAARNQHHTPSLFGSSGSAGTARNQHHTPSLFGNSGSTDAASIQHHTPEFFGRSCSPDAALTQHRTRSSRMHTQEPTLFGPAVIPNRPPTDAPLMQHRTRASRMHTQ